MPTEPCPDPPLHAAFRTCAVDNLHDGVYFVDSSRQILYWNQAAERISGYTAAEVLGRPCFDNVLKTRRRLRPGGEPRTAAGARRGHAAVW